MDEKARLYLRDIVSEWRNVLKTPANIHLISTQLSVLCAMVEEGAAAERDTLRAKLLDELSDSETQRLQAAAERDEMSATVVKLSEELGVALRERDKARAALDELFDAHYGTAYHHCGDGDGLLPGSAAQIVELVRVIRGDE